MTWTDVPVLVTGAGGFIGSHLAERLAQAGARVRALVRYNSRNAWGWLDHSPLLREMEVVAGDITDSRFVRRATEGQAVVFHLAALIGIPFSYHAPHAYVCTNVEGTLNILDGAQAAGARRVVVTSTSEVFGSARYVPMDEAHPLQGQSPYAASKIASDKLAESFHRSFGLPVVTVRPFNTYGPRQSARAVIPTIMTQALLGSPDIHLGSTDPVRDFNFVADTVEGFLLAGSTPGVEGQEFNLGSGQGVSIQQVVDLIGDLTGVRLRVVPDQERVRPPASEVSRLVADAANAARVLGWQPRYSLREGLEVTLAWVRENLSLYKCNLYNL